MSDREPAPPAPERIDLVDLVDLGIAVYAWGWDDQDRLLAECLGPLARELRQAGLAERFWCDRYDARGPHLFCLLSVPAAVREEVAGRVSSRLDRHLARHPSTTALAAGELETRHRECRGRVQCEADAYPGFAANNSYHLFVHAPRGYPLALGHGLAEEGELWRMLTDSTLWSIEQLGRQPRTAAAGWLAAVDRELRAPAAAPSAEPASSRSAAAYWRYHATTLILGLAERLESEEERVLASLPGAVGERNRDAFARLWAAADGPAPNGSPEPRRLVALLRRANLAESRRFAIQREIDHFTLKQLGLPVALHVPLVLFAWQRNLTAPPGSALG
jgi:hypothetical protein